MSDPNMSTTTVVIIGAGVAGLTLGTFLLHRGIDCIILEKHSRDYVEQRQRAGVIDTRAARMFRAWGLEDRVVGGTPTQPVLNFRIEDQNRALELDADDHRDGRFCPQRVLVHNLMDVFVGDGGAICFEAGVTIDATTVNDQPLVTYTDNTGTTRTISCEFIAGCDGDRGVSRAAIPAGHLTRLAHEFGYAWLTVLAEVPANHQSLMAVTSRGFAGQFTRGPQTSRFYLQVPLGTALADWTDERIWDEIGHASANPSAPGESSAIPRWFRSAAWSTTPCATDGSTCSAMPRTSSLR